MTDRKRGEPFGPAPVPWLGEFCQSMSLEAIATATTDAIMALPAEERVVRVSVDVHRSGIPIATVETVVEMVFAADDGSMSSAPVTKTYEMGTRGGLVMVDLRRRDVTQS